MILFSNDNVRRQDRLLGREVAEELLRTVEYGVLSMVEQRGGSVAGYGIPISYVWDGFEYIYFHSAPSGHKLESFDQNSEVSFTIVGSTKVVSEKSTTAYESVVVRGSIERNLTTGLKMKALEMILDKYSPSD